MSTIILERINYLVGQNNLNISQLETILCMGSGTISKWEISSPIIDTIIPIAKHFNISLDFLCGLSVERGFYSEPKNILSDVLRLSDYILLTEFDNKQLAIIKRFIENSMSF